MGCCGGHTPSLMIWEGMVLSVDQEKQHANVELHDLMNPESDVEIAEMKFSGFKEKDIPLLKEGVMFYWILAGNPTKSKIVLDL